MFTQWSACGFPDGTIATIYKTVTKDASSTPTAPSYTWRLRGITYHPNSGWTTSAPLQQATTTTAGAPEIPVIDDPGYQICGASGTAQFTYHGQVQFERYSINWNKGGTWNITPLFTGSNGYATSDRFAESPAGGILHGISDYLGRDGSNNEIWVSRIYEAPVTSSGWQTVLGAPPLRSPGASVSMQVSHIAYNPKTYRYRVTFSTMQPGNQNRSYFSDYSSADGWSLPWTPPPILDFSTFEPHSMAFNAAGKGILIMRHRLTGQHYLSEWR